MTALWPIEAASLHLAWIPFSSRRSADADAAEERAWWHRAPAQSCDVARVADA